MQKWMMKMLEELDLYRNIIDYIFLLRVNKFSKSGLIKLFREPEMTISRIKSINKDKLARLLITKKNSNLDYFNKISDLYSFDPTNDKYLEIEKLVSYCIQNDIKIITPFTKKIPKLFKILSHRSRDLIFVKGNIIERDLKSYSICGTRTPTRDAINKTNKMAEMLAENDFTLINGFAKGIDTEAFKGANRQGGRYIGVLASGVENVYPAENEHHVKAVIEKGALISQRLLWKRVTRTTLQLRNRLTARLSLGSIFIEGSYKSGTKWQYKFAREAGRPVFYLEPRDWSHSNSHILKIIKNGGGIEIKNDLGNLDEIAEVLKAEYAVRLE
ncbi:MAG: hypothetical protein GF329_18855 [Candidatus Lokiarchaeota archaeon]|nr:hypothetical protein [Candidatus Lokiarchaeota archaeon]